MDSLEDRMTLEAVDFFLDNVTSSDSHGAASDSSPQSVAPARPVARKKRKPTYYVRKEQASELQDEVQTLRERLAELEAKHGGGDAKLSSTVTQNLRMRHHVLQHANQMAGLQSMLSSYHASGAYCPLESFIHLPLDVDSRRRTLLALKAQKVREAYAYITERIRHMDVSRSHFAVERFETPEGHFGFAHFDVTPFEGQTLRGVYDALRFFFDHQEMSVSENLGLITIRETEDEDDEPVLQCRLVTTLPSGGELEINSAMFLDFCEHKNSNGGPHGIITLDFVNHDDMYPYQPDLRSRLDLNNVILVVPVEPSDPNSPSKPKIALVRACFGRMHRAANGISKSMENVAQDFFIRFGQVMLQVVQDHLGVE
ncbi:hypothetical protein Poli38472_012348 [Pythium oligandrum]|uniref:Uncharacterized protein n=1 Tax=Pythium oligandrum TaxID=41045 RepID=A0A8K1FPT3_PYTOL|nr:hypothetical protein Poli38472_012348 [Pythium oligandrum]|eukprot:TMW67232.1 hypothetical protein Poli38472_012348 [Pythium oligandrum]